MDEPDVDDVASVGLVGDDVRSIRLYEPDLSSALCC